MTDKRFVDIEVGADTGLIRLYTSNENYNEHNSMEVLKMLNELNEENENNKRVLKDFMLILNRIQYYFKDDNCEWENNDKLELLRLIHMGRDMLQNMDEELI